MNSAAQGYPVTSEQIFHDFRERVLGYIQSRINNPQDAEDLLSCVFLKVHERLDTYDFGKAGLSTWVYVITRNTVNDYLRRQYRFPATHPEEDALADYTQDDFTMLDKMIFEEQLESLGAALERLPDREREIIFLRFYYRYTSKQVAVMMNLSYENVRYLQHTAMGKLKKMMEKQR